MTGGGPQSGQTLIMFAIAMVFLFLGLIALVGDADTLMVRYTQVSSAALIGAQAGATDVDLPAFYQGRRVLAPTAEDTCRAAAERPAAGQPAVHATCRLNANRTIVTATVTEDVTLPIPLFASSAQVRAVRQGRAVFGGGTPGP